MRMWMVDTSTMCRKHLLGEHVEIHMLVGAINQQTDLTGYIKNDLIELQSIQLRHDEIMQEMLKRGYCHHSPLQYYDLIGIPLTHINHKVDKLKSLADLHARCNDCKQKYYENKQSSTN